MKQIKPLTHERLLEARRSWEKLLTLDPGSQMTAATLWASLWGEPLMRAAAIGLMMNAGRDRRAIPRDGTDPDT